MASTMETPPAVTPLPKMKMAVIYSVLISESCSYMFVFPFLPFMVRSFGVEESEVGFYSGWVASAFMFGQFLSSFAWGYVSDNVGIRPVVLFGLAITVAGAFCFGFSTELWHILTVRFLAGFLNGNIGVVKTYIGLITDKTNEGKAFGATALCWGVGSIFGPSIGGLLAQPVQSYPELFAAGSIWDSYPFLLPCVVTACIPLCGLIIGIFFLEEPPRTSKRAGTSRGDKEMQHVQLEEEDDGLRAVPDSKKGEESPMGDNPPAGQDEMEQGCRGEPLQGPGEDPGSVVVAVADDGDALQREKLRSRPRREQSLVDFCRKRSVILPMLAYAMLRLVAIGLDDLIPLLFSTPKSLGGLAFQTEGIGLALLGQGVMLVFHVVFFFPLMQRRFGTLQLFRIASISTPIMFLFFPLLPYAQRVVPETGLYVLVQLCLIAKVFAFSTGFTSVMILVNNSAPMRLIGTINGVAQSAAAFTSACAPALAGSAFGWSLEDGREFPFDYHFAFIMFSALSLSLLTLSCFLDKRAGERYSAEADER